jgi:chromosome segregation ATPase
MADASVAPDKQDYAQLLDNLAKKQRDLDGRKAKLEVRHEEAVKELENLKEEMKTLGTSPDKIDQDLADAETQTKTAVSEYEAAVQQMEETITRAEAALNNAPVLAVLVQ